MGRGHYFSSIYLYGMTQNTRWAVRVISLLWQVNYSYFLKNSVAISLFWFLINPVRAEYDSDG